MRHRWVKILGENMNRIFNKATKELWIGAGIGVVGIAYLAGTFFIKKSDVVSVGAEFMPRIYGILMLVVAVCQLISGYGAYQRLKDEPVKEVSEEDMEKKKVSVRSTLLVFALMIVCVGIMKIVGFIISGMIMMLGMCILLTPHYQKRNYVAYVVFSAVISFLSYFLFKNVLYVSLPRGFLPF